MLWGAAHTHPAGPILPNKQQACTLRSYPIVVHSAHSLSKQNQEHHEQRKQGNGLRQGEAKQGVADQLLGNVGIARRSIDQAAKHDTQTRTHARQSNGSASSAHLQSDNSCIVSAPILVSISQHISEVGKSPGVDNTGLATMCEFHQLALTILDAARMLILRCCWGAARAASGDAAAALARRLAAMPVALMPSRRGEDYAEDGGN
jgi:hypothetical protein